MCGEICRKVGWEKLAFIEFAAAKILFIMALIGRVVYVKALPIPFMGAGVAPVTLLFVSTMCILSGIACLLAGIYDNTKT